VLSHAPRGDAGRDREDAYTPFALAIFLLPELLILQVNDRSPSSVRKRSEAAGLPRQGEGAEPRRVRHTPRPGLSTLPVIRGFAHRPSNSGTVPARCSPRRRGRLESPVGN
jgi:hypothetical protein